MTDAALAILRICAWLCLAAGLLGCGAFLLADAPIARDAYGVAIDTSAVWAMRGYAAAWLVGGLSSWAACVAIADAAEDARATRAEIERAMRG